MAFEENARRGFGGKSRPVPNTASGRMVWPNPWGCVQWRPSCNVSHLGVENGVAESSDRYRAFRDISLGIARRQLELRGDLRLRHGLRF